MSLDQKEERGIIGFFKEYYFLSNFYPCDIICNDFSTPITFKNSEAMFQAMKCPSRVREFSNLSAQEAKRLGRHVNLREDWEEVKDEIMKYCLRSKFDQNPELKAELIKTNGLHLEEANTWGDKYWGTVNGEGKNMLGKLLMELRDEYISGD